MADADTGEKAGEYVAHYLTPDQFAKVCVALCWLFKSADGTPARFAWEMQGPGTAFGKKVVELGYRNIYYRVQEQKLAPTAKADTPGWFPSNDNRRMLLEDYRSALAGREFLNRSNYGLEECLNFVHTAKGTVEHSGQADDDDPSGTHVNHGDIVIADALCRKMCKELGKPRPAEKPTEPFVNVHSLRYRRFLADHAARQQAEY